LNIKYVAVILLIVDVEESQLILVSVLKNVGRRGWVILTKCSCGGHGKLVRIDMNFKYGIKCNRCGFIQLGDTKADCISNWSFAQKIRRDSRCKNY